MSTPLSRGTPVVSATAAAAAAAAACDRLTMSSAKSVDNFLALLDPPVRLQSDEIMAEFAKLDKRARKAVSVHVANEEPYKRTAPVGLQYRFVQAYHGEPGGIMSDVKIVPQPMDPEGYARLLQAAAAAKSSAKA